MGELTARTPMDRMLPKKIGGVALREVDLGAMTLVMPYRGAVDTLSGALEAAHGLSWPETGRMTGTTGRGVLWFGRAQALLIGVVPDEGLFAKAALVDQSDAWAAVEIEGDRPAEALARLTPVDLRPDVFRVGHTARTEVAHMAASLTRTGQAKYMMMVFRAFARTLVHELGRALEGVAARGGR
ncbi:MULTISPECIES: sarcosine oxidase subunit gamma [unclassified Roseovarius]|uniref:sarcosine oxidase subunit gamma n=1 Tax=unclassified Roseovarius TaxID=2614913 RepID=UPI00273E8636|nr:sarcosine oxidase subunit gamma [Roseovarius sp. MMSF_3350]